MSHSLSPFNTGLPPFTTRPSFSSLFGPSIPQLAENSSSLHLPFAQEAIANAIPPGYEAMNFSFQRVSVQLRVRLPQSFVADAA